jgi:tungsten cofactor oxidoreducase radical SAM maturase
MSNNSHGKINEDPWRISISPESHPRELMVELTTKCNYDCIYCFRRRMVGEELGDMPYELAIKILTMAREAGVSKISFSGWGEPLVNPRALDIIRYAKEKGLRVLLNTNGYFLQDYGEELYRLRVDQIVVSIDSPYPDTYSLIRKGGDLARLVKALLRIRDWKIRDNTTIPEVDIQFTVNKYNYKNILPMIRLAKELGASRITVSNIIPLTPEMEEQLACYMDEKCVGEIEKLKLDIARLSMSGGVEVLLPNFSASYSERFCPFYKERAFFVRRDGLVTPCIYYAHHWSNTLFGVSREIYPVIIGDLKKENLRKIWLQNSLLFRFKTAYMDYPSCLDCPLKDYCLLTLDNMQDCWGNTPTCSHCPYSRDLVRCPL